MGMPSMPSLSDLSALDAPSPPHVLVYGSTLKACAVCLQDYAPGDRLRLLDACGHLFHLPCVTRWLDAKRPATCPVCKAIVGGLPPLGYAAEREGVEDGETVAVVEREAQPRRDRERRVPSANIQLIDLSVDESWVDWFHGLLKVHGVGGQAREEDPS